jgi:hypothetical protein
MRIKTLALEERIDSGWAAAVAFVATVAVAVRVFAPFAASVAGAAVLAAASSLH